ncbi:two-component system histidine kinase PnpS [Priestia taiwanensis]|uniref:histidine kinase n=1 Tax=Priestia taiwanensis TaxID=1347902 RepID=A0A917AW18_9BACI|nr:ATP-binding protein [Priestia taiwanensis]MBM7363475.1 two-component system phosphate regulon sensor histidine kinase PhoR [Priestia taiwanensis]GGE76855.1 PAS domain-containing sensor histidine kinase [Priestia taiwanensis]
MNRFRSRLLFAIVTLTVTILVGLGVIIGQLFKSFYVDSFNKQMKREVHFITSLIQENNIQDIRNISKTLDKIDDELEMKLALFDSERKLIYATNNQEIGTEESHLTIFEETEKNKDEVYFVNQENGQYEYGIYLKDSMNTEGYLIVSVSVSSLSEVTQQIWVILTISLALAFVVILFLGLKIASQYTKPIESVTRVAIELAKGNYKARTYEDHIDETGMLSQAINVLARDLQEMERKNEMQQDRLRTLIENVGSGIVLLDGRGYVTLANRTYREIFGVSKDEYEGKLFYEVIPYNDVIKLVEEILLSEVQVRKQLMLPLKGDKRHFEIYGAPIIGMNHEWKGIVLVFHDITGIKKLEQMRKDFLANVSHELKTPITSIKGFSETLLDGAMEDEQLRQYFLTIILKESDRMQRLIQDLLDLSKIEQQGFELNKGKLNMNVLLREMVELLQDKAKNKDLTLCLKETEEVEVIADGHRLQQVFINLINNAILYTPAEGSICVTLEEKKSHIIIQVADTGIGIEEDEIPRVFERFYRVDKARSRNSGGTGLGLAIVKHLVEAHHGTIGLKSKVGEGTVFTVALPKK